MEGLTPMETALMLMCIGMGTVFIILILIIWLSNGLIQVINKVAPEEEAPAKKVAAAPAAISANVEAAIKEAIPCVKVGVAVLGLEVPHAHVHLIPMQKESDMNFFKEKLSLPAEEMQKICKKISEQFK